MTDPQGVEQPAVGDTIAAWHDFVAAPSLEALAALLGDDVVFRSPAIHTPQVGRAVASKYLLAAGEVLGTESFRYLNEWRGERSAVLAFASEVGGLQVEGVDIIAWNDEGRIISFTVMIRPLKALHAVVEAMAAALERVS